MVRVMALAGRLDSATFRYRIGQFIDRMRQLGVEVEARAIPRNGRERRQLLEEAPEGRDVVWLLRRTFPPREARILRRRARRLVFDFDDAIWSRDSNRFLLFSPRRRSRFRRTVAMADLVLAGNDYLAEEARRFNPAVEIFPTCLDLSHYTTLQRHRRRGGPLELVWIGQASTLGYLEGIMEALGEFASRRPARLRVIADRFPRSGRIEVVPVPWSEEVEVEALSGADVGLAPLRDDPWARGKCGLKVLQYMACGLPVVASPVGVQTELIGQNERGFLARSPVEWVEYLTILADRPDRRRHLGCAGRALVERHYDARHRVTRLAQLFRELARR